MKNLIMETRPSISHFTSVIWHLVKTITIPSHSDLFFCPCAEIGMPVALGREKLKRLQTGFDELRGNHAEE